MVDLVGNLQEIFQYLSGQAVWWGLIVLTVSAMLEYVVPPFPGDTVTIAGAVLIPQAGWPIWGVFGALLLGTAAGATIDWKIGRWLADNETDGTWLHRWLGREEVAEKLERLDRQFDRWGSVYISLNRFVPAFRALFFVAAGHSGIDLARVLLFGCLSAALYNGALLAVGYGVGYRLDTLAYWVDTYSRYVLAALAVAVAIWGAKKAYDAWTD